MTPRDTMQRDDVTQKPNVREEQESLTLPQSGRRYQSAQAALLELPEMVKHIEAKTGWRVDLTELAFSVVSTEQLVQKWTTDVEQRLKVPVGVPSLFSNQNSAELMRSLFFLNSIAVYLPSEKTIPLHEPQIGRLSRDAVQSALHHEVTHAAQEQNHPEYFRQRNELEREVLLLSKHGADMPKESREDRLKVVPGLLSGRMAFAEGHALRLREQYIDTFDLHPEVSVGPVEIAMGYGTLVAPPSPRAVQQYIIGYEMVGRLSAQKSDVIDELYKNPGLVDRSMGASVP